MPPALTPELALDYVRELSADVRAALVLDAAGEPLAGPPELAAAARALLAAGGDAAELEAGGADGVVCAVRSRDHAAMAVCGRFAIGAVVRHDLRTALAALEGRAPDAPDPARDAPAGALDRAPDPARDAPAGALDRAPDPARDAPAGALDRALLVAAEALIAAAKPPISAVQRDSAA